MVAKGEINPLRVVFDTNVVLSALLFRSGRVSWISDAWKGKRIIPLISKETLVELIRVLNYPKFKLTPLEQQTVLEAFLPYAETVHVRNNKMIPVCRDPHDQKFLILAKQSGADFLVTGDADLLVVENFKCCPIITPEQFSKTCL
ncbi:MAG: putative toxin-antitoxin system toxin component, PIN family [Kiritimatiellae bacterium]|nr:putative toxin-antitoxin system toxin component, PIN family [Kiritimatiellia bacterium]